MAINRMLLAGACALGAVVAPIAASSPASADPGTCTGGTLDINTSPIGMAAAPANGTVSGNIGGCQVNVNFTADNANCFDVRALVNGTVGWPGGDTSDVSGMFHVPGGTTGAPEVNRLNITGGAGAGRTLVVDQQAIATPGGLVGPCVADAARSIQLPVNSITIS
ncbi:hypothetical protein ACIP5Y_25295 [Nocardia sp. NPDC088792]|uniref:hypothetical protein n=1 Tax=Nocardia sp. NPDC088792 TaxID=3364332 RepID=UPI003826CFA8